MTWWSRNKRDNRSAPFRNGQGINYDLSNLCLRIADLRISPFVNHPLTTVIEDRHLNLGNRSTQISNTRHSLWRRLSWIGTIWWILQSRVKTSVKLLKHEKLVKKARQVFSIHAMTNQLSVRQPHPTDPSSTEPKSQWTKESLVLLFHRCLVLLKDKDTRKMLP